MCLINRQLKNFKNDYSIRVRSGIVYGTTPMCSHCGRGGHTQCLGLQNFHGLPICSECLQTVTFHYSELEKNQQHNEWMLSLAQQYGPMRVLATNIMGASATVGVALGGAAGTVAGAAIAGVRGVVQGVSRVTTGQQALPDVPDIEAPPDTVPPPPEPFVEEEPTEVSTAVSTARSDRCDGNKRVKHTFRGACEGFPAEVYFGPRGGRRPSACQSKHRHRLRVLLVK